MAFGSTVSQVSHGFGNPTLGGTVGGGVVLAGGGNVGGGAQATGVVVNATTTTVVFNSLQTGTATLSKGWLRVKTTSVNGAATITWKATLTDGSTTVQIVPPTPTTAAGTQIDNIVPFMTDLAATSLTVSLTSGTNTATYDVEIAVNP